MGKYLKNILLNQQKVEVTKNKKSGVSVKKSGEKAKICIFNIIYGTLRRNEIPVETKNMFFRILC